MTETQTNHVDDALERPLPKVQLDSSVVDFFVGKNVFITGATGFLGKVLVYKLLKTCPKIGLVHVLIRPKNGHKVEDRLQTLLKNEAFKNIPKSQLDKVVAVGGDIVLPKLGISIEDRAVLVNTVSVIFHSAATVKFDEELTKSVQMNIVGSQSVLELAKEIKSIKVLVHVSTAYSHCYQSHIAEKPYQVETTTSKSIMDLCRVTDIDHLLNDPYVTKKFIGSHPNTYTFTKAITENLLFETSGNLPLAIIRPSIVVAAVEEPFPGWVDNLNGPTGMTLGGACGLLRSIMGDETCIADIVPVDMTVNLMCVAAYKVGSGIHLEKFDENSNEGIDVVQESNKIQIFNFASGAINPITWKELRDFSKSAVNKIPFQNTLWYPNVTYQPKPWVDFICQSLFHSVPAILVDFVCQLLGRRPFLKRIIDKMHKATMVLQFFSTRSWTWDTDNVKDLQKLMTEDDKKMFPMDVTGINWIHFIHTYVYGIQRFILKDDPTKVKATKRWYRIVYCLHVALIFLTGLFFVKLMALFDPFGILDNFWVSSFLALGHLAIFFSQDVRS